LSFERDTEPLFVFDARYDPVRLQVDLKECAAQRNHCPWRS